MKSYLNSLGLSFFPLKMGPSSHWVIMRIKADNLQKLISGFASTQLTLINISYFY